MVSNYFTGVDQVNLFCFSDRWLNAKGRDFQLLFPVLYIPKLWDS